MSWVYGHHKCFIYFSAGLQTHVYIRQILPRKDGPALADGLLSSAWWFSVLKQADGDIICFDITLVIVKISLDEESDSDLFTSAPILFGPLVVIKTTIWHSKRVYEQEACRIFSWCLQLVMQCLQIFKTIYLS